MTRLLQLAAAALLTTTLAPALAAAKPPRQREDVEWLWQYTPDTGHKDGRENDLVQDPRFRSFLDQFLTAPQTFWGLPTAGKYRSLADTAFDHLSEPDKVLADDNRYITITGCRVHFCPARGLLWVDLNGSHHLVVFAAIDWTKQGHPVSDPDAEYNLWVFPNDPFSIAGDSAHPPAALVRSIARWTAQPLAGSGIVQKITHAFIVDPDGTQHEVPPASLGVAPPPSTSDTDTEAPVLKPRN